MRRIALLVALLLAVAAGAVVYLRTRPSPLPPPPTEAELQALLERRDALQKRLTEVIVANGEKSVAKAPRGGVMIGIPTSFTRSILEQVVTGLFSEMTLTLKNLKVHKEGQVRVKLVLAKRTVGKYVLDVKIHQVQGVLRPGKPDVVFGRNRVSVSLPVRLAEGKGNADIRLQWDSKGLAANTMCGDVDVTKAVTGGVIPQDYRLAGAFKIASSGNSVTLSPDFPEELQVRIFVDPSEQAWQAVEEVVNEQRAGCEKTLDKIDMKKILGSLVGRGFNVKIPQKVIKPVRLPAGVQAVPGDPGTEARAAGEADGPARGRRSALVRRRHRARARRRRPRRRRRSRPRSLVHALAQVHEHLVRRVHADEAESRVLEVDDDVDRRRHHGGQGERVHPAPPRVAGHGVAGQQGAGQGEDDEHGEDRSAGGCMRVAMSRVVVMSIISFSAGSSSTQAPGAAPGSRQAATATVQMSCCSASERANSAMAISVCVALR